MAESRRATAGGPQRIVHVFELGVIGGQFRVVESLATAQKSFGLEPAVVVVLASEEAGLHPMLTSMTEAGVEVVKVVLPGSRAYRLERRAVVDHARTLAADVVHSHGYRADVVDATAAHGAGFATVCTLHGFTGGGLRNRIYEHLQRRVAGRLDAVIAVSTPLGDSLRKRGVPADRLHVVRNGWCSTAPMLERHAARAKLGLGDSFVIGWVGRVSREKGPDVFVDAMRSLGMHGAEALVLGEGPLRQSLAARTAALPIRWPGIVQRADTLFAAFDVFVISSRTEGTPLVLLEAIAAGVPVVTTRVGGVPDVVGPEEAVLVPPEDPAAIAAAIRTIAADPQSARARATAARRRIARDFGAHRWVEAHQRVYESAIERHRSHA